SPSSVTALLTAPFASMLTRRRFRALPIKTRFNGFLFRDCGRPRFRNWLAKSRNRYFDEPELPIWCSVHKTAGQCARRSAGIGDDATLAAQLRYIALALFTHSRPAAS